MPPVEEITLRLAGPDDDPRLREFLPLAFLPGGEPSWLLATRRNDPQILGAWCLRWTNAQAREAGFFWRVDLPELRPVMLQRLLQAAGNAGIRRLARTQMTWEDSADLALFKSEGFEVKDTVTWYEATIAAAAAHIEPVVEALRKRDRLPRLEIHDLAPRFQPRVREIVVRHRLVTEYEFEYRAVPGRDAYDHQTSFVVTQGEEVKGALLIVRPEHHVAQIDVRVVDTVEPELRFGANALLLHEGLRRARLQGIDLLRFRGHDVDHRETANLAKRIGARQLGRQLALARGCRG